MKNIDSILDDPPLIPARTDYRIGVIGAGFIVRDVQLVAYRNAGFDVAAITSRTPEVAREVAKLRGIPRAYDTYEELLLDPSISIIDIALPPAVQLEVIRRIVPHADHVRGILAQKPLAMNYRDACECVRLCKESNIRLAVNQNMRFDPSMRALSRLLRGGYLGEPVFASIDMRAVPHWQSWLKEYGRLTLLNMSIHHLDMFRFLFGNPESVYVSARTDPRTRFAHSDGICLYILEYSNGFRASSWDDVWAGPGNTNEDVGASIRWRVEGTQGVAQGSIGWPGYPNRTPSTLEFTTSSAPLFRFESRRKRVWFPDAFEGTMAMLMNSVASETESEISGQDNLDTMALVDACYLSLAEHRPIAFKEIRSDKDPY